MEILLKQMHGRRRKFRRGGGEPKKAPIRTEKIPRMAKRSPHSEKGPAYREICNKEAPDIDIYFIFRGGGGGRLLLPTLRVPMGRCLSLSHLK